MRRAQTLAAVLLAVLLAGGAAYADRELGADQLGSGSTPAVSSGEWFCPHGGGEEGWEVVLQVANPGEKAASIRVRTLGGRRAEEASTFTVEPGSSVEVPVSGDGRGRASMVEWFDQWVAVGWLSHAGGDEGGAAAEPCTATAGRRWLLPDGTTEEEEQEDSLVVMNPFARRAVFSVVLLSDGRGAPVIHSDLTDVELPPYRSRAIPIDEFVSGERTVSAVVEASLGRIAAGTLGVTATGGIRSSLGYLGEPATELTFPGGDDVGRTDLVVMTTSTDRVPLAADLLENEIEQPFPGLSDSAPPAESGRTYPATTEGPASILLRSEGPGVAAARRTFGVESDQASTAGAVPGQAWLVLPAVLGSPSHPKLVLSNPGTEPAVVTLSYLAPASAPSVTVTVPPHRTVGAPREFVEAGPRGAVLAVATGGTFVPAAASYSLGREGFATYAVALGVPIPDPWVPP